MTISDAPNCTAARRMLSSIDHRNAIESASLQRMGEREGSVAELRQRLAAEAERPDSCWMWMLVDRAPSATLEAATGYTRAEWFGWLVSPEKRYDAD